jgi:hypothetical protein
MKPFQGLASGSIPERRKYFLLFCPDCCQFALFLSFLYLPMYIPVYVQCTSVPPHIHPTSHTSHTNANVPPLLSHCSFPAIPMEFYIVLVVIFYKCLFELHNRLRRWCSGNMKPFQGLASGSIPERRKYVFGAVTF